MHFLSLKKLNTRTIKRSTVAGIIIILAFSALVFRIFWLQTAGFEKYQELVIDQMTTESAVKATRGKIYDKNGKVLATSITAYRVFISPRGIATAQKNLEDGKREIKEDTLKTDNYAELISANLADILGVSYAKVKENVAMTRYLDRTIARDVNEEIADRVREFIKNYALNDMVYLEATSKRYYPYSSLASHVLGFTSNDGSGLYGLELKYNSYLQGTDGKYITARDSFGNEMPYEYESYIEAINGYDLVTTLDEHIQAVLEEQLLATLTECAASNRACGVVVNVKTGAILAMATSEGFDLNNPRELNNYYQNILDKSGYAEGSDEYNKLRQECLFEMWQNKAITDTYMPGSTFKVITTAMALEEKKVKTTEMFTCTGSMKLGKRTIHCHKLTGHGTVTFARGLQESCNPVLMTVGLRMGTDLFKRYFDAFGYSEKTGVDLPGEANSIFFDPFTETDLAVASFGQNFKITALQQICGITAVANGGNLIKPYMVEKIIDGNGNTLYQHKTEIKRQTVSTDICKVVSDILEGGVSGGFGGKNCYVPGYKIAAKTGTSEKKDKKDENGEYSLRVASCIAYAPSDDPEIALIIMVDEPRIGTRYGSTVAAPYVANIMADILPYLGIEAEYTEEELKKLAIETPSFVYWYADEAQKYAEYMGYEVEIVGEGKFVTNQSPDKGSFVEKGSARIVLYLGDSAPENTVTVPNVIGKTASAANSLIINSGLNIKIEGSRNYLSGTGAVAVSQYPAAGTKIARGDVVTITMRYLDEEN
ncbi:MAG: PASTA domain-containing protein [Clostridia bacterium]|nr:PASTA domain-containing protein [Clostridia bacterium]